MPTEGKMAKVTILLYKRPEMDPEAFRRYYRSTHGPIAARLPGLRRYVQNHVLSSLGTPPSCDGITELWFDTAEDVRAAFASEEGKALFADLPNFLDTEKIRRMLIEEVSVV